MYFVKNNIILKLSSCFEGTNVPQLKKKKKKKKKRASACSIIFGAEGFIGYIRFRNYEFQKRNNYDLGKESSLKLD